MKFMRMPWTSFDIEVLKTKARVTFTTDKYSKGDRDGLRDSRTTEYGLTDKFTVDNVVQDQQRKLCRDVEAFVGKQNMDELREVLN